ncbi:hypothetical protein ACH4CC_17315 [Streptomyces lydicus]|uniref:hypothetical protein n=1 Tax=Streptomyces lydicus TaxID=47763 RepID=UPI0037BA8A3F
MRLDQFGNRVRFLGKPPNDDQMAKLMARDNPRIHPGRLVTRIKPMRARTAFTQAFALLVKDRYVVGRLGRLRGCALGTRGSPEVPSIGFRWALASFGQEATEPTGVQAL